MSALGVREGHLYDLLTPEEQAHDPLLAACDELALLRSRSPEHARELGPWTDHVFGALGVSETPNEARLRHAACLLADTGWRAHPDYRGEQSLNMIAHAAFIGVDHPGRAYLALAIYYRHQGLGTDPTTQRLREIATPRLLERARLLGATIRLAHLVSAAMPGVIQRTWIERRGKTLAMVLPADLEPLGGERLQRRLTQLARLVAMDARLVIG
jgi:exopolyphosphatase/guanosine-5'-triphosphate,3'-diphosphate pyrophosphatase